MTWYLDGVNLSTLAWNIKHRSAGWSVPGKTGENVRIPGRHGTFWTPNKTYDEGNLTLSMWAAGCDEDGSIPLSEDGKKKVRDNLDKLTSMFATSRRLLNLRQVTGPGDAMINEATNPTMVSTTNTGVVLAENALVDPTRLSPVTTEVSRNLSTNPFLKGRTSTKVVHTEDIYPDPTHEYKNTAAKTNLITSYYYPINQDAITTNQFFAPMNGFSMRTGQNGGRGVIRRTAPANFDADLYAGYFSRDVYADRTKGVSFFLQIKLSANFPGTAQNIFIRPYVSDDGENWVAGTSTPTYTMVKTGYTWVMVPASSLPAMSAGNRFYVRYIIQIVGASNWNAGDAFDIQYVAIQDAPEVDNPWRVSPAPTMMMIDKETAGAVNRGGASQMGWTDFARTPAPGWEAVIDSNSSNTAPYAFAWLSRAAAKNNAGNLNFTVFGGTRNTFRRVLPSPTTNQSGVGIWGTFRKATTAGNVTVRLTERTGTAGSYTYTTIATVTLANEAAFTSTNFNLVAGKTYCLEVVVPKGTDGLNPSIVFGELHVSNCLLSTTLPKGTTSYTSPTGITTRYAGTAYNSTILSTGFAPYGAVSGVPTPQAKDVNATNVDWSKEPQGLMTANGFADLGSFTLPADYKVNSITLALKTQVILPPHISNLAVPNSPTANFNTVITKYDSTGAVVGTPISNSETTNKTLTNTERTISVEPNVSRVAVTLTYNKSSFRAEVLIVQSHVMVNRPPGITSFTGSITDTSATWPRVVEWVGKPYFSQTKFSVGIPASWSVPDFGGFDSSGNIMVGGSFKISTANLQPGTALFGLRRGNTTPSYTVSVKPEGGTLQSLGTISGEYITGTITIPADATFVEVTLSGVGYRPIRDVFVMQKYSRAWPTTGWFGFTQSSIPSLTLPEHPSGIKPAFSVVRSSAKTLSVQSGSVQGWSGPILSGGYLIMPANAETYTVNSADVNTSSGFVSLAARIQTEADMVGKMTLMLQQSADGITWTTTNSTPINTAGYKEYKIVDSPVNPTTTVVRLAIEVNNVTSPVTRAGFAGIVDGVAIVTSDNSLGSSFPGYFVGVRGADGVSQYLGHIRQAFVEVSEAIDMESQAYGTIAEFNVNLVVPSAFWEDVYDTTQQLTASGASKSGSMFLSEFRGATAPMQDVLIEVTPVSGSITKLTLEDRASGNFVKYSGPAQSKININTKMSSVVDVNNKSIIRYVSGIASSNIMSLTPYKTAVGESIAEHLEGSPIIDWTCNVPIKVRVIGRRKYLLA